MFAPTFLLRMFGIYPVDLYANIRLCEICNQAYNNGELKGENTDEKGL